MPDPGPPLPTPNAVPARQVAIPPTDRRRYITGVFALNVRPPEGTTGDWHDVFHWRDGVDRPRVVQVAGVTVADTHALFGDFGVYEGRDRLVGKGLAIPADVREVFVANHLRAILDLLHASLREHGAVLNLTGATDDWLDTPEQQETVLELAPRIAAVVAPTAQAALHAWIVRERRGRSH